jgi:uncharacterized protein (DUF1778 family)
MSKGRPSSSESLSAGTVAVAERSSVADTEGSINLRIDFMIESVRREAIDVLLDRRLLTLDSGRYDAFVHALDNPPPPGPKLRSLLRRVPAWQK